MYEKQISQIERVIGINTSAKIIVIADWITERFSEESTWRGTVGILTAMGVIIDGQRAELIIAFGMLIIGSINFFKHDEVKSVKNRIRDLQDQLEKEQSLYKKTLGPKRKKNNKKIG